MITGKDFAVLETRELYCHYLATVPNRKLNKILVTGASGYIGGRLVPELLARGYSVRIMARQSIPDSELWPGTEVAVADALESNSLDPALQGIDVAFYLIHSLLLGPKEFESVDVRAAINFRDAAKRCNVKRIIYLGGLGDSKSGFRASEIQNPGIPGTQERSVPVTILRAAIIIGSGSASYEIINHLIRNTPVLLIPNWAHTLCQPIAVRDVIKYLVGTLETDGTSGGAFDIGGDDILSYEEMLRVHADILGKKRLFVRVPVSDIRVYSYIASLLTPVPQQITRCLFESGFNEVVCREQHIKDFLPFKTLSYREALVRA